MPIMLRSDKCHLYQKSEHEMNRMKECFHDPGGYFVVKGQEKVCFIYLLVYLVLESCFNI